MSQCDKIWEILKDGQPHSTYEICDRMFPEGKAGLFRLGARVFNINERLKKEPRKVRGMTDKEMMKEGFPLTEKDPQRYWYQLVDRLVKPLKRELNGQLVMI